MKTVLTIVLVIITMVAIVVAYFLPTIIAAREHSPKAAPVAVVNFFLGWTFIGWVVALAMAVSGPVKPEDDR